MLEKKQWNKSRKKVNKPEIMPCNKRNYVDYYYHHNKLTDFIVFTYNFFVCFLSANDHILQYQLGFYIFMQKI